jgi:hypothetical protein
MQTKDVESVLEQAGFRCRISSYDPSVLWFEDDSILGFVGIFDTAEEMVKSWSNKQATFIQRNAAALRRSNLKAWNCYAILLCAEQVNLEGRQLFAEIEGDLSLTRKIVAEGISTQRDLQRALLPILPIQNRALVAASESLDLESRLDLWPKNAVLALEGEGTALDVLESLLDSK